MAIQGLGDSASSLRTGNDLPVRSKDPVQKIPVGNNGSTEEPLSVENVKHALDQANDVFTALATHLQFKMHEASGEFYVSVVNEITNEVVREIPPKKFLDMHAEMKKHMKGIFVHELK